MKILRTEHYSSMLRENAETICYKPVAKKCYKPVIKKCICLLSYFNSYAHKSFLCKKTPTTAGYCHPFPHY